MRELKFVVRDQTTSRQAMCVLFSGEISKALLQRLHRDSSKVGQDVTAVLQQSLTHRSGFSSQQQLPSRQLQCWLNLYCNCSGLSCGNCVHVW